MSRPSAWMDTVFARVLALQLLLVLAIAAMFAGLVWREQAVVQARATAPLWALALAPVLRDGAALPRSETVSTNVELVPGPPPASARRLLLVPRLRAIVGELRELGVPVRRVTLSGYAGGAVTWLQIEREGGPVWVGVRGEFEGTDLRDRSWILMWLALGLMGVGAWWLSRVVVRPLRVLRAAIRGFQLSGQLPPELPADAPAELRELGQQFASFARQQRAHEDNQRLVLAAISHDLRSPLGRIRMAAELLPDDAEVAPRREAIVRNVQLADRMVGSFIDLARAGEETLVGRVDLKALVQTLMQAEGDLRLAAPLPDAPCAVQPASAIGLERALRNLIDNARQHGATPIEIGLRIEGREAVLSVRDHGPGIAADQRDTLIQPFRRGQASRSTPGTGLGLAIVQRSAIHHGGRLQLDDAAPGLVATLRLPLAGP